MSSLSRTFSIVTYMDSDLLFNYLKNRTSITNWLYIIHNKDESEPHIHLAVRYRNARSLNAVKNEFKWLDICNTFVEIMGDKIALIRYFTHEDEKEKAKYSTKDFVTNDYSYWIDDDVVSSGETGLDIIDCLLSRVRTRDMVKRFGHEFIIHYNDYAFIAQKIKDEEYFLNIYQKTLDKQQEMSILKDSVDSNQK